MIFETHAHYEDEQYDADREAVLGGLQEGGVGWVVNIGSNVETSRATVELTERHPFIYGAVGIHPGAVKWMDDGAFEKIVELSKADKVVAIGETGLDYYGGKGEAANQIEWFVKHIDLAKERGLPLVVHSRDAAEDTLCVMQENRAEDAGGVVHCFSYSAAMAREFVQMGFFIGIGGVVTFRNAKNVKEVVKAVPLTSIVLETDCPYLAPEPHRGKRNQSDYLSHVAREIASLRGVTFDEVVEVTRDNALYMYRIAPPAVNLI